MSKMSSHILKILLVVCFFITLSLQWPPPNRRAKGPKKGFMFLFKHGIDMLKANHNAKRRLEKDKDKLMLKNCSDTLNHAIITHEKLHPVQKGRRIIRPNPDVIVDWSLGSVQNKVEQIDQQFDGQLAMYKKQFIGTVIVHYKSAIHTLATEIVKPLADAEIPTDAETAEPIITALRIHVVKFSTLLQFADINSDSLRSKLDKSIESLVVQHSAVQKESELVENEIQKTNAIIKSTDAIIVDVQKQIERAEEDLRYAQHVYELSVRQVEEARHCITDDDSIFGDIANVFCHFGHVDDAKDTRHVNEQYRNSVSAKLPPLQNLKQEYETTSKNLQQKKITIEQRKGQLQIEIKVLEEQRNGAVSFGENVKKVIVHLTTLHGKSMVLKDVVYKLIDVETVLTPLQAIADQVLQYTGEVDVINEMKMVINDSISKLKEKLPQYPLINFQF